MVGGPAEGFVGFSGVFGGSTGSSGISTHSPVSDWSPGMSVHTSVGGTGQSVSGSEVNSHEVVPTRTTSLDAASAVTVFVPLAGMVPAGVTTPFTL